MLCTMQRHQILIQFGPEPNVIVVVQIIPAQIPGPAARRTDGILPGPAAMLLEPPLASCPPLCRGDRGTMDSKRATLTCRQRPQTAQTHPHRLTPYRL